MFKTLERKLSRFAIPNLTLYLVAGQALFFLISVSEHRFPNVVQLVPALVEHGQVWRLVTFLFIPMPAGGLFGSGPVYILFLFIELYLLYLMGSALEAEWGAFRYNVFVLVGWVANIAAAWFFPDKPASNLYLMTSILLAFAILYPDFLFYIWFILPVKAKWLGVATWIMFGINLARGDWATRLLILASTLNFVLFFGRELLLMVGYRHRAAKHRAAAIQQEEEAFHRCIVCDKTEQSDPDADFRYCPECSGAPCYCEEHISNHEHR